jgi:N-acetylmuramoyl-L-alanine amidase
VRLHPRPSPNHGPRPTGARIDMLLLHYTGMRNRDEAIERLCDPAAEVSAHYLIDEDGTAYRLVAEEARAWHAGVSHWAGDSDVNSRSIGIELVNPGHEFGYRPFPDTQIDALTELSREILARHRIPPARVLGHSDVAPVRKQDPGELFPWARLARSGIGLWPDEPDFDPEAEIFEPGAEGPEIAAFQESLVRYGYGLTPSGRHDDESVSVLRAFQRHFRPAGIDGRIDPQCRAIAGALAACTSRKH